MADLYGTTASSSVNNGGSYGLAPSDSEEISHILNQLLHNSSASSCMSFSTTTNHLHSLSSPPTQSTTSMSDSLSLSALFSSRLGHPDCLPFSRPVENRSDLEFPVLSDPASGFGTEIKDVDDNTFSSGGFGLDIADSDAHNPLKGSRISYHYDDFGDFSCDSEKDAPELQSNPIRPRISSKRTRDAEVHNLSEKRRRSRINEKMKVLQSLIPNSNKTDKASMLDEAIHYLKQLQLQVQMLALRNGLSLHPTSLPGVALPMQLSLPETLLGYNDGDHEFQNSDRGICRFTRGEETSLLSACHASGPCTNLNQPIGRPSAAHTTNLEDSIGCKKLVPPHYRSLNQPTSSKELHNDGCLQMLSDATQTEKKSSSDVNILSSRSPDVQ